MFGEKEQKWINVVIETPVTEQTMEDENLKKWINNHQTLCIQSSGGIVTILWPKKSKNRGKRALCWKDSRTCRMDASVCLSWLIKDDLTWGKSYHTVTNICHNCFGGGQNNAHNRPLEVMIARGLHSLKQT